MRIVFSIVVYCAMHCVPCNAAELLIENVTIISPDKTEPLNDYHVLIRDDRIAEISDAPINSQSAARLDASGKFLTPGLMDSHVHVSSVPGMNIGDSEHEALIQAYRKQQPRSYLYFGVTQLVDLHNTPEGIGAFEREPQRPDLFHCGGLPVLNGYPTVFVPPDIRYDLMPNYIVEPDNDDSLPPGADAAAHTPEAAVERIAQGRAICVKLFVEDGFGDANDWPILSVESMKRVIHDAHERGLVVLAHANALDMQALAVEAGVDVLAHGLWNWTGVDDDGEIPPSIENHLKNVHAANIGWQATLRVMPGQRDLFVTGTLDDPFYSKVVPPSLLAWYRTDEAQGFKEEIRRDYDNLPDTVIAQMQWNVAERNLRATNRLHQLGHPLLLGSDTPSAPTYGNQPGYDTFREMQLMSRAGIPPAAILESATINNAQQFRLDKDYGTVEVGKIANLLLLNEDPLVSVDAWNSIETIILHGEPINRQSLAADAGGETTEE